MNAVSRMMIKPKAASTPAAGSMSAGERAPDSRSSSRSSSKSRFYSAPAPGLASVAEDATAEEDAVKGERKVTEARPKAKVVSKIGAKAKVVGVKAKPGAKAKAVSVSPVRAKVGVSSRLAAPKRTVSPAASPKRTPSPTVRVRIASTKAKV